VITALDIEEVIDNQVILKNNPSIADNTQGFNGHFSDSSLKKNSFDGIRLLYGKLNFKKPVLVTVASSSPYIEMYFSLKGSRHMIFSQSRQQCMIPSGHHNMLYIPDTEFYIEPDTTNTSNISLQVQFTEEYFQRFLQMEDPLFVPFLEKIDKSSLSILSEHDMPITAEMYTELQDIVNCEKKGIFRQLFIETRVLNLLRLQFEQYEKLLVKKKYSFVKDYDIEKIYQVKEILDENINSSYSLKELAQKVGLNDFKLKKGFKEIFGITVFGYLSDLRMKIAKEMLSENNKSISEISEYCGYSFVQSFITAFKNKYGITPDKFRK